MTEKPDNGAIIAQEAIPIGPDDTAQEVFNAVTGAAARALERVLPALLAGVALHQAQDLAQGAYFKGRKPEDGRIDFAWGAQRLHNVVLWRSALEPLVDKPFEASPPANTLPPTLFMEKDRVILHCADGRRLRILSLEANGESVDAINFERLFGSEAVLLA